MNIEDLDLDSLRVNNEKKKNPLTIVAICICVVCVLILVVMLIWLSSAFSDMNGIVEELKDVSML